MPVPAAAAPARPDRYAELIADLVQFAGSSKIHLDVFDRWFAQRLDLTPAEQARLQIAVAEAVIHPPRTTER